MDDRRIVVAAVSAISGLLSALRTTFRAQSTKNQSQFNRFVHFDLQGLTKNRKWFNLINKIVEEIFKKMCSFVWQFDEQTQEIERVICVASRMILL